MASKRLKELMSLAEEGKILTSILMKKLKSFRTPEEQLSMSLVAS